MPDNEKKNVVRILPQKNESIKYDYLVGRDMMQNFGKTFDDFTLLHYDNDYARKVGFERTPVQGALISCLIVKSIVQAFGDSAILRVHNLEFINPVYPESEISIELYVISNLRNKLVTLRSRVYTRDTLNYQGLTKIKVFNDI